MFGRQSRVVAAAVLASAAVSLVDIAPTGAQTTYDECGGGLTEECIVAFTVDGAAPPGDVSLVVEETTTALSVQVQDDAELELAPTLSTASEIHIELNVGDFDPAALTFTGVVEAFTPVIDADDGNTVTLDVKPRPASFYNLCDVPGRSCGDDSTRATTEFDAVALGNVWEPPSGSALAAADTRGTWIETNAQESVLSDSWATTDLMEVVLGAPHLHADGSLNTGTLRVFLPDALLSNGFGIANGATMTSESLNLYRSDRAPEVAEMVTRVAGGNILTGPSLQYSVVDLSIMSPPVGPSEPPTIALDATPSGNGYWIADNVGNVFPFGNATLFGDMADTELNGPVIDFTSTVDGGGYWMVGTDGGIFNFGNAGFFGSMGGIPLNQPVVGMASTDDGDGYWQVASDGGIFAFAGAQFFGSMGGIALNQPVVGMAPTASGNGYWLVAADGGIFSFGDALFYGSMGSIPLNQPVVGMVATTSGNGYMLVAADGGLFAFGDAVFHGSMGGQFIAQPVVGMDNTPDGGGYWQVAADGGIFAFGNASFFGSHAP